MRTPDKRPVYEAIASLVDARLTCQRTGNAEWFVRHTEALENLVKDCLPSGSGIDNGTTLDLDRSTGERLVFHAGYHHMDQYGMYAGWTDHQIVVTASLFFTINVRITGPNRNDILSYLVEVYRDALMATVDMG